ncbi:hypothetical protein D3C87_2086090 [compost metagenome]
MRIELRQCKGGPKVVVAGLGPPDQQIVADGVNEYRTVLAEQRHMRMKVGERQVGQGNRADANATR